MSEHTGRKIPATAVGCRTVKPWEILALWLQGCGGPWRRNLFLEKALRIVDVLSPRWPCEVVQWGGRPPTLSAAMFEFRLLEGNNTTVYNKIYTYIYLILHIMYTHTNTNILHHIPPSLHHSFTQIQSGIGRSDCHTWHDVCHWRNCKWPVSWIVSLGIFRIRKCVVTGVCCAC